MSSIIIPTLSSQFDEMPDLANVATKTNYLQYDDSDLVNIEVPANEQRLELARKEAQKLVKWLKIARPGAYRIYHTGNLMAERETDKFADLAAKVMMHAAEKRLVLLMQRASQNPGEKEYLAYRSEKSLKPEKEYQLQMIISNYGVKNEEVQTKENTT